MNQSLSTTTTTATETASAALTLPLPEELQLINTHGHGHDTSSNGINGIDNCSTININNLSSINNSLYSTSSSIMSINEHAGHGHGHAGHGYGHGHGGQHQQNANRSVLGSMLQIDDIFGNSFPSSTSINDHTHHALLNGSSNNSNVNANANVNVNVHNSSSNNNNIGNGNSNNNNNGNSNSSIQSNAFSNDNISVSTGTASVSSVQVNRASNCNSNSNIDANLNGMYYSNGGNGPTQNQNQNHGHVNGHVNGHSNSNGNNNVQMYVSTNETDDKNSISGSNCNTNNNTSNGVISTDVPVKYKICMGRQSSSFTITLLVPVPVPTKANNGNDNANVNSNANSNVSPFQKVVSPEDNSTFHDNNGEVSQAFALRIPLSYLIQQQQHQQQQEASNAESGADSAGSSSLSLPLSSPLISKEAPWLDRTVIRNRINDGGRAIGLEPTFAFQAAIAVEETASKLPQWLFPLQSSLQSAEAGAGTGTEAIAIEAVSVEIILSEGIATLVASATATANANANRGADAGNSNNNGLNLNNSATATATSPPKSGLDSSLGGAYVNMNGGIISHPSGSNNSSPLHQPSSSISMDRNSNYSPLAVGQRSNQVNQVVATSPINGLGLGSVSASASCGGASPSPRQHYNVLNEKGVGLLATAPSFPPPGMGPSRPRPNPNPNHSNGNGNGHGNHRNGSSNGHANGNMHMNGSNINSRNVNVNVHAGNDNNGSFPVFRTSPTENQVSGELYFNNVDHGNGNGNHMNTSMNMNSNHGGNNGSNTNNGNVFNSQLLGSSLGSWTSYSGQHQRPAGLSSSFQGPSSTISMMNSFGMPSSRASAASANGNNNNIIGRGMHNGNDIKNTMHLSSSFPSYNYGDMIMREHQRNNNHRSINSNNNSSAINIDRNNLNINHNHNGVSTNRPNPSMIIGPLLNMGFSKQECEAAAVAIHRHQSHETIHKNNNNTASSLGNMLANHHNQHQHNNYHDNNNNFRRGHVDDASLNNINRNLNQNQQESDSGVMNALNNMSLVRNSNLGTNNHRQSGIGSSINISNTSNVNVKHHHHQSTHQGNMQESLVNGSSSSSVWGNAGKMKMIKTPTNNMEGSVDTDDGTIDSGDKVTMNHMANIQMGGPGNNPITLMQQKQQPQQQEEKMIRVLDIPPDLNAFVFHCNSQTRDECLERGLFGCPSGGQYGPHSKAKKGDLLFLADFSAWTVTGIFTAKTDAGLNLEKSAWGGRFPWQIKVNTWSELRTVHIDKINEIIGLASGSKLNMLTKDQLMQLVTSTEFGPNVPDHLFKMKRKVSV